MSSGGYSADTLNCSTTQKLLCNQRYPYPVVAVGVHDIPISRLESRRKGKLMKPKTNGRTFGRASGRTDRRIHEVKVLKFYPISVTSSGASLTIRQKYSSRARESKSPGPSQTGQTQLIFPLRSFIAKNADGLKH